MKRIGFAFCTALLLCVACVGCQRSSVQLPPQEVIGAGVNSPVSPESGGERPNDGTNPPADGADPEEITKMYITVNGNKLEVTLADNSSVEALIAELRKGDIVYTADDYGNFEKVGSLGRAFPRNDEPITTSAGDVILYQGNSLCLYYGRNSWNFTRIGRIEGYSESELRVLLGAGAGSVQVRIGLNER